MSPKTAGPRESTIVAGVIAMIRELGGWAEKNHGSPYGRVKPDVTGCIGGIRLELEVKRPGQKATDRQIQALNRWMKAGAVVGVVTSVDEARTLVWSAMRQQRTAAPAGVGVE